MVNKENDSLNYIKNKNRFSILYNKVELLSEETDPSKRAVL